MTKRLQEKTKLRRAAWRAWRKTFRLPLTRREKDTCTNAYWSGCLPADPRDGVSLQQWVEDGCPVHT